MSKKEKEIESVSDGSRAITKVHVSDVVIMVVISVLCLTCILPFLHLFAKSISSNAMVMAKKVFFWPKQVTFDAYTSIFRDGTMVYSMVYSAIMTVVFTLLGMIACRVLDATVGSNPIELFGESINVMKNPSVGLDVALEATLLLIIAGTLAGMIPARKAARVKPIEALRAE